MLNKIKNQIIFFHLIKNNLLRLQIPNWVKLVKLSIIYAKSLNLKKMAKA